MLTVVLFDETEPRTVAFDRDEVTIGRLPSNDVVLESASVSPHHARLRRHGDAYVALDLGSRTGTFVRGARVVSPTLVRPGESVRIGSHTIEVGVPPQSDADAELGLSTMIRERPHDDEPRLVYADWLEER